MGKMLVCCFHFICGRMLQCILFGSWIDTAIRILFCDNSYVQYLMPLNWYESFNSSYHYPMTPGEEVYFTPFPICVCGK